VEPVKANFWKRPSSMSSTIHWPVEPFPPPKTTLRTPGGRPASSKSLAKTKERVGASSEGFHTTAFPVRTAGMSFQLGTAMGKFPAVMIPTTPKGLRKVKSSLSRISLGTVWP